MTPNTSAENAKAEQFIAALAKWLSDQKRIEDLKFLERCLALRATTRVPKHYLIYIHQLQDEYSNWVAKQFVEQSTLAEQALEQVPPIQFPPVANNYNPDPGPLTEDET